MGFFDRFKASSPAPQKPPGNPAPAAPQTAQSASNPAAEPAAPEKPAAAGGVMPRLAEARAKLDSRDLTGAMAVYEEVLSSAGDRADVLVRVSGDLGVHGHVQQVIELVAPRYDAQRHGPATGLNLLQAYLVARQEEPAQHLLDILFALQRPELEERLLGFSNALAELMAGNVQADAVSTPEGGSKINMVTISKPIWYYALEAAESRLLPTRGVPSRRVAFTQLAIPGLADYAAIQTKPEDEIGRLTRGFPLWLAETFFYSAGYEPVAALGVSERGHYALLPVEWTAENVRQLVESNETKIDFVVTGWLKNRHSDFEAGVRIWEVKKFRELKAFSARWTPSTADKALADFHQQLRTYMEWTALPADNGIAYALPASPMAHVQSLGASLTSFLAEKKLLPAGQTAGAEAAILAGARANPDDVRAQLAVVSAMLRLKERGEPLPDDARRHACEWLATEAAQKADVAALLVKLT